MSVSMTRCACAGPAAEQLRPARAGLARGSDAVRRRSSHDQHDVAASGTAASSVREVARAAPGDVTSTAHVAVAQDVADLRRLEQRVDRHEHAARAASRRSTRPRSRSACAGRSRRAPASRSPIPQSPPATRSTRCPRSAYDNCSLRVRNAIASGDREAASSGRCERRWLITGSGLGRFRSCGRPGSTSPAPGDGVRPGPARRHSIFASICIRPDGLGRTDARFVTMLKFGRRVAAVGRRTG